MFSIFGRKSDSSSAQEPDKRFHLALVVVLAAFVLIAIMLGFQYYSVNTVINSNKTGDLASLNQSNQTIFNTLLPLFGAWVGVVVTFYFGSKQAEKAQEALVSLRPSEDEKLATLKVQAILDKYPETQHPIKVKLTDQIKDVLATFSSPLTDVLVVDKDDKPIGGPVQV